MSIPPAFEACAFSIPVPCPTPDAVFTSKVWCYSLWKSTVHCIEHATFL